MKYAIIIQTTFYGIFVFFYKIISLLLISSPLVVSTEFIYFPYSFLGLTLFILSSLFSDKNLMNSFELLFWLSALFSILTKQVLIYQVGLSFFIIYHHIYFGVNYQIPTLALILFFTGLCSAFIGLIYPLFIIISCIALIILIILHIIYCYNKKEIISEPIIYDIENNIIPYDDYSSTIQEQENVIPLQTDENSP